jgi:hypothetical protein
MTPPWKIYAVTKLPENKTEVLERNLWRRTMEEAKTHTGL